MTWLERILATPCPNALHQAPTGDPCDWYGVPHGSDPLVCASRIAAAEGAEPVAAHRCAGLLRGSGPWGYGLTPCVTCGAVRTFDGKRSMFSNDNGVTWTPGPDACPGRRP